MKNFGENKIRITLDMNDLAEKHIDFHEFMSNPINSQSFFLDVLDQAEKEIGFITKDCQIKLEALATSSGNFVLTVTRILPSTNTDNLKRKVKVKRKSTSNIKCNNCAIFAFDTFDDFYDYGVSLTSNLSKKIEDLIGNTKLYLYNNTYYLIIDKLPDNLEFVKLFSSSLLEFGKFVSTSNTYKNKIIECGEVVIRKNAILCCSNKFRK